MEKVKPQELDYRGTEFEDLGYFIEYLVDGRLIGTKNVDTNPDGKVGHESTKSQIATETIQFKRKKIKKGTEYQTRYYPLCGKVIKKQNINKTEIMSKVEPKKIKEAPGYLITESGQVLNESTKKMVTEKNDRVRLSVAKGRKTFKVSELKEQYFPKESETKKSESKKTADKPKEPKNEAKKEKSGAQIIRDAYEKAENEEEGSFSIKDFAKESGIAYHRVWGAIKQHKARIAKQAKEDAKN